MNFIARILTFFLLIPFSVVAAAIDGRLKNNIDQIVSDMDAYTETTRKSWDVPAVAVVIVHKGKVYYILKGTKSISDSSPINEHTRFQVLSLTKGMTATLMVKLAEQGRISLDDPIVKYIPDFKLSNPKATKTVTIGHVLAQNVGLKAFAGDSFLKLGFSQKELWSILAELSVKKQTGKDYTYNNHFHGLMKQIIEKVTRKSFEAAAKELLFDPLKMSETTYAPQHEKSGILSGCTGTKKLPNEFAKPHTIRGTVYELPNIEQAFVHQSSMAVSSSVEDMGRWLQFLMYNHPALLKQEWFDLLRAPQNHYLIKSKNSYIFPKTRTDTVDYCYGAMLTPYGKNHKIKLYTHNGAWIGGTSRITFAPALDLGVVVLCNLGSNQDCMAPEALTFKCMDLALGIDDTDWNMVILDHTNTQNQKFRQFFEHQKIVMPHPHEDLTPYVGDYKNNLYGDVSLKIKENALWMKYRKKWVKLTHLNGNRFVFDAYKLADGFSSSYYAFVDLGYLGDKNKHALSCNLMPEGDEPVFVKM
jgi:CubicO group peptidase (beta-lactamase class C family)